MIRNLIKNAASITIDNIIIRRIVLNYLRIVLFGFIWVSSIDWLSFLNFIIYTNRKSNFVIS